ITKIRENKMKSSALLYANLFTVAALGSATAADFSGNSNTFHPGPGYLEPTISVNSASSFPSLNYTTSSKVGPGYIETTMDSSSLPSVYIGDGPNLIEGSI